MDTRNPIPGPRSLYTMSPFELEMLFAAVRKEMEDAYAWSDRWRWLAGCSIFVNVVMAGYIVAGYLGG